LFLSFSQKYVAGTIILLTVSLNVGMMFGFSAILLPQLEEEKVMSAKSEEASWIGEDAMLAKTLRNAMLCYFYVPYAIHITLPNAMIRYVVLNYVMLRFVSLLYVYAL
jgi:hypothetical protein